MTRPDSPDFPILIPTVSSLDYRVIFADTDAWKIVYHARYLEMFERGRTDLIAKNGSGSGFNEIWNLSGIALPVVECQMKFHYPAKFDDLLHIETTVDKVHRRGINFHYQIFCGNRMMVSGFTNHIYLLEEHPEIKCLSVFILANH